MGLKAIAVYRDGCKRTQPLSTSAEAANSDGKIKVDPVELLGPDERRLLEEYRFRKSKRSAPSAIRCKLPEERGDFGLGGRQRGHAALRRGLLMRSSRGR